MTKPQNQTKSEPKMAKSKDKMKSTGSKTTQNKPGPKAKTQSGSKTTKPDDNESLSLLETSQNIDNIVEMAKNMNENEQHDLFAKLMQAGLVVKQMAIESGASNSDTDDDDDDYVIVNGKRKAKTPKAGTAKKHKREPIANSTPIPQSVRNNRKKAATNQQTKNKPQLPKDKVKPIVIEGLTPEEKANHFEAEKRLKIKEMITKHVITKGNKYLVFPRSTAQRDLIMAKEIEGIIFRDPIEKQQKAEEKNTYIVLENIHPSISDEEIQDETGFTAKRIISGRTQRPTWKVKLDVITEQKKDEILKDGLKLGYQNYRAVEYKTFKAPLMCFKCQKFDHISTNCENEEKCKKCSGNHNHKDCESDTLKCANCGKDHPSTFRGCQVYQNQVRKLEGEKLSYAQAVAKPLNDMEALRLATTLVLTTKMLTDKLRITVSKTELAKDIVGIIADTYKAHIDIAYIIQNITQITERKNATNH